MPLNVLVFGALSEITGSNQWQSKQFADTEAFVQSILNQYPSLRYQKFSIAVNKNIVSNNTRLNDGDTIALLPPFSGG